MRLPAQKAISNNLPLLITGLLLSVLLVVSISYENNLLIIKGWCNFLDWPVHFANSALFQFHGLAGILTSPHIINLPNYYPWLADLPTGLLSSGGLGLKWSFLLPKLGYTLLLFIAIQQLLASMKISLYGQLIFCICFFFNGGPGIVQFLLSHSPAELFSSEYPSQLCLIGNFPNTLVCQLMPSPGFLLGLGLFITTVISAFSFIKTPSLSKVVSIFIQLMLLAFAHSFCCLAAVITIFCLGLRFVRIRPGKLLLVFSFLLSTIALLFVFKFHLSGHSNYPLNFFDFGWIGRAENTNIFGHLYRNTGLMAFFFLPILLYYSIVHKEALAMAGVVFFVLDVVRQWAPNPYDNLKIFVFFFFFGSLYFSLFTQRLFENRKRSLAQFLFGLAVIHSSSGIVDILNNLLPAKSNYLFLTSEELGWINYLNQLPADFTFLINDRHIQFVPTFTRHRVLIWNERYLKTYGVDFDSIAKTREAFFANHEVGALCKSGVADAIVRKPGDYDQGEAVLKDGFVNQNNHTWVQHPADRFSIIFETKHYLWLRWACEK